MIRTRGNAKYETVVTVIGEKQVTKKVNKMAGFNDPNFCQPMTFKLNFTFVLFCFIFSIREEMDD